MATPRDFLTNVVFPNADEFEREFASERHAFNAVMAIDAAVARLYHWLKQNKPDMVVDGERAFRRDLRQAHRPVGGAGPR